MFDNLLYFPELSPSDFYLFSNRMSIVNDNFEKLQTQIFNQELELLENVGVSVLNVQDIILENEKF